MDVRREAPQSLEEARRLVARREPECGALAGEAFGRSSPDAAMGSAENEDASIDEATRQIRSRAHGELPEWDERQMIVVESLEISDGAPG